MTFTIYNLQTGKQTSFTNRDQFLFEMEQIETRHLATNTIGRYTITHADKSGQTIEQVDLEIPPTEGDLQEVLQGFGLTSEGGGLFSRRKPKKTLEVQKQAIDSQPSPKAPSGQCFPARDSVVGSNSLQSKVKRLLLMVGAALMFGLAAYGAITASAVASGLKNGTIQTVAKPVTNDTTNEHEVDVFSRYFLGTYFSGSDLDNYVSSKVDAQPFEKVTTSAVLLEKATPKGKGVYEMTYVVSYVKDDQAKSSRFTFTVKPSKKAMYGYEVTKMPKQSNYPG